MKSTDASHSFTATVPTIVKDLGYTSANAQLMTIPIYVFAVICVLIVACEFSIDHHASSLRVTTDPIHQTFPNAFNNALPS